MRRIGLCSALLILAAGLPAQGLAAPAVPRPSRAVIRTVLTQAYEVSGKAGTGEHLSIFGKIVTVSDGHGGTLTAVPVVRYPTADAYGQLVLFWHDGRLVGSQSRTKLPLLGYEVTQVGIARAGVNSITLRFARYRRTDALCCPSLPPGYVTYRWVAGRLAASGPVPGGATNGLRVIYRGPVQPRSATSTAHAGLRPIAGVAQSVAARSGGRLERRDTVTGGMRQFASAGRLGRS